MLSTSQFEVVVFFTGNVCLKCACVCARVRACVFDVFNSHLCLDLEMLK